MNQGASTSATWGGQPATDDWDTASHWDPAVVPMDAANFGASSRTGIAFSPDTSATVDSVGVCCRRSPYSFKFGSSDAHIGFDDCPRGSDQPLLEHPELRRCFYRGPLPGSATLKFTNSATAGGDNVSYYSGPGVATKLRRRHHRLLGQIDSGVGLVHREDRSRSSLRGRQHRGRRGEVQQFLIGVDLCAELPARGPCERAGRGRDADGADHGGGLGAQRHAPSPGAGFRPPGGRCGAGASERGAPGSVNTDPRRAGTPAGSC